MTSDQPNNSDEFCPGVHGEESVEDFIKELEAKEKDLHISSESVIEVEDSDFDGLNIPEFILNELDPKAPKANPNAPKQAAQTPANAAVQNELRHLKQKVNDLIAERADLQEKSLRRMNEFENFKNRMERERRETFKSQLANLATKMLPVLDNLNRALDFASAMPEEKRREIQEFFDGIVLVNQQVNDVFAGMGVSPITSIGEEFDPNLHEAVSTDESGGYPPNTVADEFLRGYRLGSSVIRHSMVKVAKSPTAPVISEAIDTSDQLNSEFGAEPEISLPDTEPED